MTKTIEIDEDNNQSIVFDCPNMNDEFTKLRVTHYLESDGINILLESYKDHPDIDIYLDSDEWLSLLDWLQSRKKLSDKKS